MGLARDVTESEEPRSVLELAADTALDALEAACKFHGLELDTAFIAVDVGGNGTVAARGFEDNVKLLLALLRQAEAVAKAAGIDLVIVPGKNPLGCQWG